VCDVVDIDMRALELRFSACTSARKVAPLGANRNRAAPEIPEEKLPSRSRKSSLSLLLLISKLISRNQRSS
jgi:hypothetical protein